MILCNVLFDEKRGIERRGVFLMYILCICQVLAVFGPYRTGIVFIRLFPSKGRLCSKARGNVTLRLMVSICRGDHIFLAVMCLWGAVSDEGSGLPFVSLSL
jgi:hypothetical protein